MKLHERYGQESRRPKAYLSSMGVNLLQVHPPIIPALWSVIFPGFGHILQGNYIKGLVLVLWEVLINSQSNLNVLFVYTFSARWSETASVVSMRWVLLYIAVFWFAVWDSYRIAVDNNRLTMLADRNRFTSPQLTIDLLEINYFDRRKPWVGVAWSLLSPGLGHLYAHRLVPGFFVLLWWVGMSYASHLLEVVFYTFTGNFSLAVAATNAKWLLFMPSMYTFVIYDAYVNIIECNKIFNTEQANYLRENYQYAQRPPNFFPQEVNGMNIVSTFEHSLNLELAITDLELRGIKASQVFAVPLEKQQLKLQIFDSIHRADGMSVMDLTMICGAFGSVLGGIYGFVWTGGPLLWGLIGFALFALIGGVIKYCLTERHLRRENGCRMGEVVLIVNCEEYQVAMVEEILCSRSAFALAKVGRTAEPAMT